MYVIDRSTDTYRKMKYPQQIFGSGANSPTTFGTLDTDNNTNKNTQKNSIFGSAVATDIHYTATSTPTRPFVEGSFDDTPVWQVRNPNAPLKAKHRVTTEEGDGKKPSTEEEEDGKIIIGEEAKKMCICFKEAADTALAIQGISTVHYKGFQKVRDVMEDILEGRGLEIGDSIQYIQMLDPQAYASSGLNITPLKDPRILRDLISFLQEAARATSTVAVRIIDGEIDSKPAPVEENAVERVRRSFAPIKTVLKEALDRAGEGTPQGYVLRNVAELVQFSYYLATGEENRIYEATNGEGSMFFVSCLPQNGTRADADTT